MSEVEHAGVEEREVTMYEAVTLVKPFEVGPGLIEIEGGIADISEQSAD